MLFFSLCPRVVLPQFPFVYVFYISFPVFYLSFYIAISLLARFSVSFFISFRTYFSLIYFYGVLIFSLFPSPESP